MCEKKRTLYKDDVDIAERAARIHWLAAAIGRAVSVDDVMQKRSTEGVPFGVGGDPSPEVIELCNVISETVAAILETCEHYGGFGQVEQTPAPTGPGRDGDCLHAV